MNNNFVDKNKDKCKIIYNEKEYELIEYFIFDNNSIHNDIIKIQLKIKKNITDISYMFSNCKELLSIRNNLLDNSNITNINTSISVFNSYKFGEETDTTNRTEKKETFL